MTRSRKKTPIFGATSADSEKEDKRICNRKYRKKCNVKILHDEFVDEGKRSGWNVWSFAKDGKRYYVNFMKEWMRK